MAGFRLTYILLGRVCTANMKCNVCKYDNQVSALLAFPFQRGRNYHRLPFARLSFDAAKRHFQVFTTLTA